MIIHSITTAALWLAATGLSNRRRSASATRTPIPWGLRLGLWAALVFGIVLPESSRKLSPAPYRRSWKTNSLHLG